jgi:hypothetical protein
MTYVIVLLAIFGKEGSRGRHRENGSECGIFRELCNNEPKIANSMYVRSCKIENTELLMVVRMLKEEEKEDTREGK